MSVLVEQVFSTLLAPSMMIFHTSFVLTTIIGKPVTWNAQDRGDRGITFLDALNRHKWHVLFGLVWGAAILLDGAALHLVADAHPLRADPVGAAHHAHEPRQCR